MSERGQFLGGKRRGDVRREYRTRRVVSERFLYEAKCSLEHSEDVVLWCLPSDAVFLSRLPFVYFLFLGDVGLFSSWINLMVASSRVIHARARVNVRGMDVIDLLVDK